MNKEPSNDEWQQAILQYADDLKNSYSEIDFNKDSTCHQMEAFIATVRRQELKRMNMEPAANFNELPDKQEVARQLGFELKEGE